MSPLPPAPGAKAARVCGILAIVFAVTCVGIPVALVLGVVALVQHAKAKRLAAARPDAYAPVPATGLVTGIVGLVLPVFLLPVVGIASAIVVPALLSSRAPARDKAATENLVTGLEDLTGEYDRLTEARTPPDQIPGALETRLQALAATTRNPWRRESAPYLPSIRLLQAPDLETMTALTRSQATDRGTVVFLISLPDPAASRPGFLGGAVRLGHPVNGDFVTTKVQTLD